ncbi:MAG: NADPH-dependent FMN reductase [Spirochaetota bacterium]
MSHKIALLYGSVRTGRLGIRVVHWLERLLNERGHTTSIVDQKEYALPMLDAPLHFMDPAKVPENVQKIADILTDAEGFVVVGGEYNHAIQPGLSNLIDYFYKGQFGFKPGLIATYSYGPFGGVRTAVQLRALLAEVGMVTIPNMVAVGSIAETLSEAAEPQNPKMNEFAGKAIDEFEFYLRALAAERKNGVPG